MWIERLRIWLLKRLIGNTAIVANVVLDGHGSNGAVTVDSSRRPLLLLHVQVRNVAGPAFRLCMPGTDEEVRVQAAGCRILPLRRLYSWDALTRELTVCRVYEGERYAARIYHVRPEGMGHVERLAEALSRWQAHVRMTASGWDVTVLRR